MIPKRLVSAAVCAGLWLQVVPDAQPLAVPPIAEERGHVGLGLALRRLQTVGVFLQTTAHPDDENNGVLAMLKYGQGVRTALATATRGNGGQNEIGPELFEALAVLRTEELLAAHRFDGAEQYFTRAIDFGYSFSLDETFEKWGRQEILGDYVRLIRSIRPDVVAGLRPDGAGGGQHHQGSAVLTREAFRAAADPTRFPDQIADGLRPWQAKKLYFIQGFGFRGEQPPPSDVTLLRMDTSVYDPLLGRTYAEVGSVARSMHKCQGVGQFFGSPGPAVMQYRLVDTTLAGQAENDETTFFDGIDSSIASLARYGGPGTSPALDAGLAEIARQAQAAERQFERGGAGAVASALVSGLSAVRRLRQSLATAALSEDARYEVDVRLETKEAQFEEAAVLAHGLRLEALADDGLVVAGQPIAVTAFVANRQGSDVSLERVTFPGLDGDAGRCIPGRIQTRTVFRCEPRLRIPSEARLTAPYWKPLPDAARQQVDPDAPFGSPFRPTPFRARFELRLAGAGVTVDVPVEHRYQGDVFGGEKRMELKVVPPVSVRVSPEVAIIPAGTGAGRTGAPAGREVRVTMTNGTRAELAGRVTLELPAGWTATPVSAPVTLTREDEAQTVRFHVRPPEGVAPGEYRIRARADALGERFDRGYQVVEYPHIQRRHLYHAAESGLKVIEVRAASNLTIGYIEGVGDEVPPAIEQLGARLQMIDSDELAWGDLSRYDAIVTGVRAYERRQDLRAHNNRLIEYARGGGTLIVQYNKFEFNEAQFGPYPAQVSQDRVTDEFSPVRILAPDHPLFQFPNRIGEAAWKGWVQERGLYFLGARDPRHADLVELQDPFAYNKGPKRGALVEAQVGEGRWIYVGLGLWRQLPAGTDGAYQLLANLISLGRAPRH